MARYFQPGEVVVLRNSHPELGVERGSAVRVVEDTENRTILYAAAGSSYKQVVWMGHAPPAEDEVGKFEEKVWRRYSTLQIKYADVPWTVRVMWLAETDEFVQWYVNIESPRRRTAFGFDAIDYELDIVVNPDFDWRLKDERELELLVGTGLFTRTEHAQIREFATAAARDIDQRAPPFNEPWPEWRPDPTWQAVRLPEDDSIWMNC